MKCERARELFSDYVEGGIDYALTATLRGHIDECPDCKREFEAFKQTWGFLGRLPEVQPPANLRHDVVMRLVRTRHEEEMRAKQGTFGLTWGYLFGRLVPARAVAIACAGAALAAILINLPRPLWDKTSDLMYGNKAGVEIAAGQPESPVCAEASLLTAHEAAMKERWRQRPLQNNTLWISAVPLEVGDDRSVYCVTMSINTDAVLQGATARIAGRVYLLPERTDHRVVVDDETIEKAQVMYEGDVLIDGPATLHWPVYYTSRGPGASKLLVTWTFRKRQFAKIVYIPTKKPGECSVTSSEFSPSGGLSSIGGELYTTLDRIAQDYAVPIIANAQLDEQLPVAMTADMRSWEDALRKTLLPVGLTWRWFDSAVYVDRKLGNDMD